MHTRLLVLLSAISLAAAALAVEPMTTWQGLVGMFTEPTAQTFERPTIAGEFAEIRFSQENTEQELENKWYCGSVTGTTGNWEIAAILRHEVARFEPTPGSSLPVVDVDDNFITGSVKYLIRKAKPNTLGLAVGVIDIANQTNEFDGLDTRRGSRGFLVGSYNWLHGGISYVDKNIGAFAGSTFTINDNVQLIAEYNTRPMFVTIDGHVGNPNNFNIGVRCTTKEVPNLHFDLAAVGDGKFNFGFAVGYNKALD